MRNGHIFEHLVLAYTMDLMNDLGLDNFLEILILTLRSFTKLPVLRYLGICNVLYIWHIRVIPTYRVYRLYDSRKFLCGPINYNHKIIKMNVQSRHDCASHKNYTHKFKSPIHEKWCPLLVTCVYGTLEILLSRIKF